MFCCVHFHLSTQLSKSESGLINLAQPVYKSSSRMQGGLGWGSLALDFPKEHLGSRTLPLSLPTGVTIAEGVLNTKPEES